MTTNSATTDKPSTSSTTAKKKSAIVGMFTFGNMSMNEKIMLYSGIAGVILGLAIIYIAGMRHDLLLRNVGIAVAIIVAAGPSMIINMRKEKRADSIDQYLPLFLLNLVGAMQSGMTLLRAIEHAAERDFGSLTPELKNLKINISWGMPYEEAFEQFGNRIGTVMGRRVAGMLHISLISGGDTTRTIDTIQRFVSDMRNLDKERKSAMKPYIITIYIAFGVFLVTSILLVDNFFYEIETVQAQLKDSVRGSSIPPTFSALLGMNIDQLTDTLFHMSIIEAVFGGLAAGKIGEGKFMAGIKHVQILVVITIVAFSIIGTGSIRVTGVGG
jgi:flagellar protein FlaJ